MSSCGGRGGELDRRLSTAEQIMDAQPDSAYAILSDSVTTSFLSDASERQKALYGLLFTQAQYKNYIVLTEDSLISVAAEYFNNTNDSQRAMLSLYYKGRFLKDHNEWPDAIISLMKAHSFSIRNNDIFWQARIDDAISSLFSRTHFYNEGIKYSIEATELYKKLGKEDFYLFSMGDLALHYFNSDQLEKCKSVLDSIGGKINEFNYLSPFYASKAISLYSRMGKYKKAEQFGDTLIKYFDDLGSPATEYADIANVKIELDKFDEAQDLLKFSHSILKTPQDSIYYYTAQKNLHLKLNAFEKAYKYGDSILNIKSRIESNLFSQSAIAAQRNYYSEEAQISIAEAKKNKILIIAISLVTILLTVIGYLIYRNRIKTKNSEISRRMTEIMLLNQDLQTSYNEKAILDKNMQQLSSEVSKQRDELNNLSENLSIKESANKQLNEMIETLLQKQFTHLNTVINEYTEQKETEGSYMAFYKNIEYEIEKFKQPKSLKEIERIVDECKSGIITKIREQLPHLSEKNITLIVLSLAGLNARAIGLFTGMQANSTYKRRKQLSQLILQSDAKDKELFANELLNY